jgi:hypothetical protein
MSRGVTAERSLTRVMWMKHGECQLKRVESGHLSASQVHDDYAFDFDGFDASPP